MRDLGDAVGVKPPALYNHFSSKEEILNRAVRHMLTDFLTYVTTPIAAEDPSDRLCGVVRRHTIYQLENRELARANDALLGTAATERILPAAEHRLLTRALHEYLDVVRELVRAHALEEEKVNVTVIAFAVLAICDRVSLWYQPGGALTIEQTADRSWILISRLVVGR